MKDECMLHSVNRKCRRRVNGIGKDGKLDKLVTSFYRIYRVCKSEDAKVVVDQNLYRKELKKLYRGIMIHALKYVSSLRSNIGAQQNRLEHTIKNQNNIVENTQAAESLIRDADMADEMVKYSKENILQQVGQSMLAQSNQSRQGILTLLQ